MFHILSSLDEMVAAKGSIVRNLQYKVARATKVYNDTLQTLTSKLYEAGVPMDEINAMGFNAIPSSTSQLPAGLVAR